MSSRKDPDRDRRPSWQRVDTDKASRLTFLEILVIAFAYYVAVSVYGLVNPPVSVRERLVIGSMTLLIAWVVIIVRQRRGGRR